MSFIHVILGISTFSRDLQNLSLKYCGLQIIVSGIYLSHAWISLYYLTILDSFFTFGTLLALGMFIGALLDLPLGILTDRFGQRNAFCCALFCLVIYYSGLIFAKNPIELVFLETIVGIYSALISGSYVAWFMNSWEVISLKDSENELSFRTVMGNISFIKTIITALVIFIGGIFLQHEISPQTIFLSQAIIAAIGVVLGFKFISSPKSSNLKSKPHEKICTGSTKQLDSKNNGISRVTKRVYNTIEKYIHVTPFFFSFSLLAFTSVAFNALILSPLLYDINSPIGTFNRKNIEIEFATISIMLISITRASSDLIFAFASRLSGRATSFIHSPYKGILLFYTLIYPISWFMYLYIIAFTFSSSMKVCLIILIVILRVILAGLATGLYWQLYYNITSSETRSAQESLYNTIYLLLSIIGYAILGSILESFSFDGALIFLFFVSTLGILILILAQNPGKNTLTY
jgi:MFS family permease